MDDDRADLLSELGLSTYEARAYLALARHGGLTADAVADRSEVPRGRVYDVLNSLVDRSLARADDDRPRTYVNVEPTEVVDRLLERRVEELESQRSAYERTAAAAESVLSEVADDEPTDGFATSALHEEAARDLLLERFAATDETIRIAAEAVDIDPEFETAFADRLRELLEVGISVQLLASDVEYETGRLEELIDDGMAIRHAETIPQQRFIVLDDDEVCLEVVNPAAPDELLAVVNLRDEDTARELAASFDELWVRASPWRDANE